MDKIQILHWHKQPIFIKNNKKETVYYWWWEYLRRNADYKNYCQHTSFRKKNPGLKKLYEDFGDIYAADFDQWWFWTRHLKLFIRAVATDSIQVLDHVEASKLKPDKDVLYLKVPLKNKSKRTLQQEFSSILQTHHWGKRGKRNVHDSVGRYEVLGHPDMSALQKHLKVYDIQQDQPELHHWQIAQKAKLFHDEKYLVGYPDSDCRNTMTATVSRHLKKANALIHNVGLGRFPDYTPAKK